MYNYFYCSQACSELANLWLKWIHTVPEALPLFRSLSLSQSSTLGGHLARNTPSFLPKGSAALTSPTLGDQIQLREKAWRH